MTLWRQEGLHLKHIWWNDMKSQRDYMAMEQVGVGQLSSEGMCEVFTD